MKRYSLAPIARFRATYAEQVHMAVLYRKSLPCNLNQVETLQVD